MESIRIGNPIVVKWVFKHTDGTPFPLANYSPELFFYSGRGKTKVTDTSVLETEGNLLIWHFNADAQTCTGAHSLTLKAYLDNSLIATFNISDAFILTNSDPISERPIEVNLLSNCDYIELNAAIQNARHATDMAAAAAIDANDAAGIANINATLADEAAGNANAKANLANQKAELADQKANLADSMAQLAESKAIIADDIVSNVGVQIGETETLAPGSAAVAHGTWNPSTHKMTIDFGIPRGYQGNSGYQGAAGELEVVNNLTDGGSTAALSAEMGKALKEELDEKTTDNVVIALSAWGSNPSSSLNVGEYGYKSSDDTIIYKTINGDKVIQANDKAMYLYNEKIYRHSASGMLQWLDPSHLSIRVTGTAAAAGTTPYTFVAGRQYAITNTGAAGVNFSTRLTPSGSNIDTILVGRNNTKILTASVDANYLRYGDACTFEVIDLSAIDGRVWSLERSVAGLPEKVDEIASQIDSSLSGTSVEGGSEFAYEFVVGHQYRITNTGNSKANFSTRLTKTGDTVETIGMIWRRGDTVVFVPTVEAHYLRIGQPTTFTIEDITLIGPTIKKLNSTQYAEPMVHFEIPHTLRDVSSDIAGINFSAKDAINCFTIMEQVYDKFDALVTAHPGLITREDIVETLELEYPEYAALGGEASGDYLATPTYQTNLYKIVSSVNAVNGEATDMKKRKLLLIAGTHGDERASVVNTYLFAKWLLESDDVNAFKYRAAFDVYILPCLNGYGLYHSTRDNADGVNINRNYPFYHWEQQGAGTTDWTGPSAGSTFEAQLVMALTESITPDMAVDHHNYAVLNRQFYTDGWGADIAKISHQALVDCSYTFVKDLPAYFGSAYKLFMANGDLPGALPPDVGFAATYWHQKGVYVPLTIEISRCINFLNGSYAGSAQDNYGSDTFAVGDYTLRTQLMLYGEYALRKIKNAVI